MRLALQASKQDEEARKQEAAAAKAAAAAAISDESLAEALRRILESTDDVAALTAKSARKQLEKEFSVSLKGRKDFITKTLISLAQENASGEDEEEEEEEAAPSKPRKPPQRFVLSAPMSSFMGGASHATRKEVQAAITAHVKGHDLQDPSDRRNIVLDDALKPLFKGCKTVTFFSMQKYLTPHLKKDEDMQQCASKRKKAPAAGRATKRKKAGADPAAAARKKAKKLKKAAEPGRGGGLMQPRPISAAMSTFLGGQEEASRTEIVKAVWAHVKKHELQNPADKREFVLDAALKSIFEGHERVTMFTMNKYIGAHLL